MEKILIIVDGYSSGSQLPGVMNELGWKCVHVQSSNNLPAYFLCSFRKEDYIEDFTYQDDIEVLISQLKEMNPLAVLPGTESGVLVADIIADALNLPGNSPSTSLARRNKHLMHQCIKDAGLRHIEDFLATDFGSLLEWARGGQWPVILKPQDSAGTDSVVFCESEGALRKALNSIYGKTNQLGNHNDAVLAQRQLVGPEYFINGISHNGKHSITEIWQVKKIANPDGNWIYDRAILFDPKQLEMQPILKYVHDVLDALGIVYGASHTELIWTDDGPTLIECGSRLSGGLHRAAANYAVGGSQIDLVGRLVAENDNIDRILDKLRENEHAFPLWQVQLVSNQEGIVTQSFCDELRQTLKSKTWIQRAPKVGDHIKRTVDLFSSLGIIFMSHSDTQVMEDDYQIIREWERTSRLFTIG